MLQFFRSQQAVVYALCVLAIAIPLPYTVGSISIIITIAAWLGHVQPTQFLQNLKTGKILWLWLLFFLLHVVSYTYSLDKSYSIFDLQRKLCFILFPLIIGAGVRLNRTEIQKIFLCFVVSLFLLSVFCIGRAILIYETKGTIEQFFYHSLVRDLDANAVYCSLYALFSLVLLLFFPFSAVRFPKWLKVIFILVQVIFLILLSSRTLILLFFAIILPYYAFFLIVRKKKNIAFLLTLFIMFGALGFLVFKTDNPIRKRYTDILNSKTKIAWVGDYQKGKERDFNNLSLRLFLWQVAIDNVKEHHLWLKGAGNGSATILQNKKIEEYGISDMNNEANRSPLYDLNVHNMYLQTLLELGVPGVLMLIAVLMSLFFIRPPRDTREVTFILSFVMIALAMQESVFETQAGIVFYSFFAMVLYSYASTNRQVPAYREPDSTSL